MVRDCRRRQIHRRFRKPLVVMSPKSLLRHPEAVSPLAELTDGGFRATLDDLRPPSTARRLVICAGKIFYALDAATGTIVLGFDLVALSGILGLRTKASCGRFSEFFAI